MQLNFKVQTGLLDQVIETFGLDIGKTLEKSTPTAAKLLLNDADGDQVLQGFSYSSIVRMLLYLARHARPDISYVINCFGPRSLSHAYSHSV